MAAGQVTPPPGFVLDSQPTPPPGFVLDTQPTPPPGFVLDSGDVLPEGIGIAEDQSTGFLNNLRNPIESMSEHSIPAKIIKYLMGNTEEAKDKARGNPLKESLSAELSQMEADGLANTPEYLALTKEFDAQTELDNAKPPEATLGLVLEALKSDPGMMAAELTNAVTADPELLLTPAGWEFAAARAAERMAHMGKVAQTVGKTAAGATGSGSVAGGVTAPISIADQLQQSGEVSGEQVLQDSAIGAVAGAALVTPVMLAKQGWRGVSTSAREFSNQEIGLDPARSVGAAAVMERSGPIIRIPGAKTAGAVMDAIIDWTGGKAISPVRRAGKTSPSIQKIADTMDAPEDVVTAVGPAHHERVSLYTGQFISRLQDALLPVTRTFVGGLKRDAAKEIVAALRGGTISGDLVHAVREIRSLMDDMVKYANEAGMTVNRLEDYFPRIYNQKYLESHLDDFISVLSKHGIDPVEGDMIAQKILNQDGILEFGKASLPQIDWSDPNAVKQAFFMRSQNSVVKDKNLEFARKLTNVPDSELAPFLEGDLYPVLTRYIETAVRRAEWTRSFGKGGKRLDNLVKAGIRESIENGNPVPHETLHRIYNLADALQGNYRRIENRFARAANKWMGSYQILRTMTWSTLSSLSEPLVMFLRADAKYGMKGAAKAMVSLSNTLVRSVYKKFPKDEATRALEDIGLGLDAALSERLTAAFGGENTAVTSAFFKANLLHDWTKLNRVMANETGKSMVTGYLRDLAKGVKGVRRDYKARILTELGVDVESGLQWIRSGASRQDKFYEQIKLAGLRFTNEVVMNPRATNRPMWHSNPHYHLISQLKGFQTVFGNTVVKRLFKEIMQRGGYSSAVQAYRAAFTASTMVLVAMVTNDFREYMNYGSKGNPKFKKETDAQRIVRAIDRTGFTGVVQFAIDFWLGHRFGQAGKVSQLAGPTFSQMDELGSATSALKEGKTQPARSALANAIPVVGNIKPLRDAVAGRE